VIQMWRQESAKRIVSLLTLVLLCLSSAWAREHVNVRLVNNAVLVPVRVNDHDLSFLFDTGSEDSVIDPAVASSLGLRTRSEVEIQKNYRSQATGVAEPARLGIGKLTFDHVSLTVVSLVSISRALGVAVDGVLGNDVLQGFTFEVNYSKQELGIVPSGEIKDAGISITLRRSANEFFVPLQIASVPVELLLDTGTNSTNLSWKTWQKLTTAWTPTATIEGVVRAGFPTPPAFMVCIPSVRLGDIMLADQAVRVQRAVGSGAFSGDDFGGILGSELLRQFEVTFDLKRDRIFLKKDAQYRPDPYRYVTVGIQFAPSTEGTYSVMSVWKDSPADEAGIRLGDRINAIDGESTVLLSAEQLSAKLHGEEGTAVNLISERNGVSSAVTLHTRELLCRGATDHQLLQSHK
jgi:predicted aspartyl protease